MFPDDCRSRLSFEYPGSAGAGPRQTAREVQPLNFLCTFHFCVCVCVCLCVCVLSHFSHVWLFVTPPWTVACQAFLSMGFFRQECWSGLPRPPPGDHPDSGIERASPTWQADSLLLRYRRSPPFTSITSQSWIKWVLNIHRLKTDLANRCGMYFHWTRTSLRGSLYAFQHSLIIWWA